jgi:hypothetical protein
MWLVLAHGTQSDSDKPALVSAHESESRPLINFGD